MPVVWHCLALRYSQSKKQMPRLKFLIDFRHLISSPFTNVHERRLWKRLIARAESASAKAVGEHMTCRDFSRKGPDFKQPFLQNRLTFWSLKSTTWFPASKLLSLVSASSSVALSSYLTGFLCAFDGGDDLGPECLFAAGWRFPQMLSLSD